MEDSLKFIWKEDNLNKDFIIWQEILYFPRIQYWFVCQMRCNRYEYIIN